jgi:hypothetical protein
MALTRPQVIPPWADAGDKVQPTNSEIQTGWPLSNLPPSRSRFNWLQNFFANGILYLTRRGIADWDADELYEQGDYCRSPIDGYTYRAKVANDNLEPSANDTEWELWAFTAAQLLSRLLPLTLDSANGRVGINSPTPLITLDANGTDAIRVPRGTTAQRPAGADGYIRVNTTLQRFEGYINGIWGLLGGGAVGGGTDQIFYENGQTVNSNYTITTGKNAMTAGPITIADGVTVTVPDGSTWTIV